MSRKEHLAGKNFLKFAVLWCLSMEILSLLNEVLGMKIGELEIQQTFALEILAGGEDLFQ